MFLQREMEKTVCIWSSQQRFAPSLSEMLLEDCTFTADVLLIGWAMNFASNLFWQRLHVAFSQRSVLPGCNKYALVIVMDRGIDQLHFKDRRQRVLQKADVIQRDHGKNVTYSFLIGERSSENGNSESASSSEQT